MAATADNVALVPAVAQTVEFTEPAGWDTPAVVEVVAIGTPGPVWFRVGVGAAPIDAAADAPDNYMVPADSARSIQLRDGEASVHVSLISEVAASVHVAVH